ncbi:MAG: hypothetical protein WBV82_18415 [Myxococcaceae bacterium]
MPRFRSLALAALGSALLTACATPPPKPAPEGSTEKIQAKPEDPFADCQPSEKEGVSVLECGDIVGVFVTEKGEMGEEAIAQNLKDFQAQFPPAAKRERFTQKLGDRSGSGIRVIQQLGGSPFRAELFVVPMDSQETRIVSCAVKGSTDFDRCTKMLEALAESGIPARLRPR